MLNYFLSLIDPNVLELTKLAIILFGVLFLNFFFKHFFYGFFDEMLNDIKGPDYSDMDPFSTKHSDPKYKHSQVLKKRINTVINVLTSFVITYILFTI